MKLRNVLIYIILALFPLKAWSDDSQLEAGKQVYDYWCMHCHGDYRGPPGTAALKVLYEGTDIPADLEKRTDMTPEFIEYVIRNGRNVMPLFRKAEINDPELDALTHYLTRNNNK